MPVDTAKLRKAHKDILDLAAEGGFGPPAPGEWDASRLLAHLISADASIASVALAVAAGQRPAYDNRPSLDDWNLRRIGRAASGLPGLARLLRGYGEILCAIAEALPEEDLALQVPVLIMSNDEVVVDQPQTLRWLVEGVADIHLPLHATQLRGLRPSNWRNHTTEGRMS
jgi:hypothetical protein